MNDLVFVMCNLKLRNKQATRNPMFDFDDIHSDDEWITEKNDDEEAAEGVGAAMDIQETNDQDIPVVDVHEPVESFGNLEDFHVGDEVQSSSSDGEKEDAASSDEDDESGGRMRPIDDLY